MKRNDHAGAFLLHHDPLAEELACEFLEKMTSGEDGAVELRDAFYDEEIGGPFVPSTGGLEFADDVDESNPLRSRREPFPRT